MFTLTPGEFILLRHSDGRELKPHEKRGPVLASTGAGGEIGRAQAVDEDCALWILDWEDELRLIVCVEVGEAPHCEQLHALALKTEYVPITNLMNLEPANDRPI